MTTQRRTPTTKTFVEGTHRSSPEDAYRRRHADLPDAGRFVRFVNAGGMGAIVLVEDHGTSSTLRRLAVKLLRSERLRDAGMASRFRRELASHRKLSGHLQVPRLVPCLRWHDDDDPARVFGLFPFYEEGTLEDALARNLKTADALRIVADAVEGLQSLHGHKYVHRDFHPSNIFLEHEVGRLRGVLGDLGVGMFLNPNSITSKTQLREDEGLRAGHHGYVDPCCLGSPQVDLFAVGATLYRILAGENPPRQTSCAAALVLPEGATVGREARREANALLTLLTAPQLGQRIGSTRAARGKIVRLAERLQERRSRPSADHGPVGSGRRKVTLAVATVVLATLGYGAMTQWRKPVDEPPTSPPELLSQPTVPVPKKLPDDPVETASGGETKKPPPPRRRETPPEPPPPTPPPTPPLSVPVSVESTAPVQEILRVETLLKNREFRQAEVVLRRLFAEHPSDSEVAIRLALLVSRQGDAGLEEARGILTRALECHPRRGELRLALARVLHQQAAYGDAVAVLKEAPPDSSHGEEIRVLRITLDPAAAQVR